MTLGLNGKGLVLGGRKKKIEVIGVLGIYIYLIYITPCITICLGWILVMGSQPRLCFVIAYALCPSKRWNLFGPKVSGWRKHKTTGENNQSVCMCVFIHTRSRWCFETFLSFIPTCGNDTIWLIFDEHIFQLGWNHQLVYIKKLGIPWLVVCTCSRFIEFLSIVEVGEIGEWIG